MEMSLWVPAGDISQSDWIDNTFPPYEHIIIIAGF